MIWNVHWSVLDEISLWLYRSGGGEISFSSDKNVRVICLKAEPPLVAMMSWTFSSILFQPSVYSAALIKQQISTSRIWINCWKKDKQLWLCTHWLPWKPTATLTSRLPQSGDLSPLYSSPCLWNQMNMNEAHCLFIGIRFMPSRFGSRLRAAASPAPCLMNINEWLAVM